LSIGFKTDLTSVVVVVIVSQLKGAVVANKGMACLDSHKLHVI